MNSLHIPEALGLPVVNRVVIKQMNVIYRASIRRSNVLITYFYRLKLLGFFFKYPFS